MSEWVPVMAGGGDADRGGKGDAADAPDAPDGPDGPGGRAVDRPGRLVELSVVDLALIDRLRLSLEPGLNVLTGETGAGKSLLIDALGLALGARADTSLVRHGAETARVEALFDRVPEPLIAVREVSASGRSTARLDDATVTAARLAETTGPLVEIHGQHEQSRLLDERWQRDLLDAFGGHGAARRRMAGAVGRWRDNRAELETLAIDPREIARRLEVVEHEAAEIAAARIRVGEADELRSRLAAAREGAAIARGGSAIREALDGDAGARTAAGQALREARSLARLDPRFEAIEARLVGIDADVGDIASEVRGLLDAVDNDAAAVAALEERLSTIYALERRYGDEEAAIVAHGERAALEAERLRGLETEQAARLAEDAVLLAEVAAAAAELGTLRRDAAARLSAEV
ncbi:MAG TPA: AAA family ATPase, partial [Candidatus Limnocylindrales bacterium]|nr:AAA family ATPase [Candidatus Limnocylindrales bacterium]